ncbi:MAG: hypothetical protein J5966_09010 [Lachnospiraceae bacterium]|nr:hypothetical protein [Lachnospiraceae bacterium]
MHAEQNPTKSLKPLFLILLIFQMLLLLFGCGEDDTGKSAGKKRSSHSREDEEEEKGEYYYSHLKLSVTDSGYDLFTPSEGSSYDSRYGPSMILTGESSIDAWFSYPANGNELDWISYIHSDDAGRTWSDEKVVLSSTPNGKDAVSVCDPDVFYYKGYYYIGYTSTMVVSKEGYTNSIFLARSGSPEGPYEKWNGKGWGGSPEPLIYYDGLWNGWGCGEPAFVVMDDELFIYSTRDAYSADLERITSTEVHIADLTNDNWPGSLEFAGYAVIRSDTDTETEPEPEYAYSACDSWDVAYYDEADKFIAVCTNRRLSEDSCLLYYESNDGIYFERVSEVNHNVCSGAHNCGMLTDRYGHLKKDDLMLIGYAYAGEKGSGWGTWATRIAPVSIDIVDEIDRSEEGLSNLKTDIAFKQRISDVWPVFITADSLVKRVDSSASSIPVSFGWVDTNKQTHAVDPGEITFRDYDKRVISVKNGSITPLSSGMTYITIEYEGLYRQLCLCVMPDGSNGAYRPSDIDSLYSPVPKYTVSLSSPYAVSIRPLIRYADYSMQELDVEGLAKNGVTFTSANPSLCEVREDGLIIPLSPGETEITVNSDAGFRYNVAVEISE